MFNKLSLLKGVHPGIILERELKKRKLPKGQFALSLKEYPQTLGSITKGKRKMNPALALKIEKELGLEEGYLMVLQAFYDIEREKQKQSKVHPDLTILRPVLFWDTKMEKIDWQKHKRSVIKRVFERGNEAEKKEMIRFYGAKTVNAILKNSGK